MNNEPTILKFRADHAGDSVPTKRGAKLGAVKNAKKAVTKKPPQAPKVHANEAPQTEARERLREAGVPQIQIVNHEELRTMAKELVGEIPKGTWVDRDLMIATMGNLVKTKYGFNRLSSDLSGKLFALINQTIHAAKLRGDHSLLSDLDMDTFAVNAIDGRLFWGEKLKTFQWVYALAAMDLRKAMKTKRLPTALAARLRKAVEQKYAAVLKEEEKTAMKQLEKVRNAISKAKAK